MVVLTHLILAFISDVFTCGTWCVPLLHFLTLMPGLEVYSYLCRCSRSLAIHSWWVCSSISWLCECQYCTQKMNTSYLSFMIHRNQDYLERHISLLKTIVWCLLVIFMIHMNRDYLERYILVSWKQLLNT